MYKRKIGGGISRFEDNFGVFLTFFYRFCFLYGVTEFDVFNSAEEEQKDDLKHFDIMFIIFL